MPAASAGVMAGYSALITTAARTPPIICAAMKLGTDDGAIPAKVGREHPADGDGGIGEAGRGGEEIRRADVGADSRGREPAAPGPGQREDHQQQPGRAMTSDRKWAGAARC